MKIEPLSKALYNEAKSLGIETITLNFSGGNDEGHLSVQVFPYNPTFAQKIEDWAWEVYSYNGAGEGNDYGDDVVYDLEEGTATTTEWYTARSDGETDTLDNIVGE